ncbi:PRA1 family protein F3-like [Dioscorea cayenensis subsp. rotundata]|uniref:PRA1 family protein n=1 Tax=Dioscorea cayennensis subsp. rotundata TaxID=55577 RepID=A0AB40CU37_DIOCR|nr:PRA1 family protein F3-like [Dioscorea cayenensis subsp. rotundata]
MAGYGTIPTSSAPESGHTMDFISRAKERGYSALATRRPWREMVHRHAFNLPPSLGEAYLRIRTNIAYFSMNYAIIVLVVVFVSLLWHPISLIVFLLTMAAWLFLYFLRDEPIVLFHRTIGDRTVLIVLSVVTLVLLLFTNATANILISLLVGLIVVLLHAAMRRTEDLGSEEEGAGHWYSVVGETFKGSPSS